MEPNDQNYHFSLAQLDQILTGAIEMYVEQIDVHGNDTEMAKYLAVAEMIGGLEADRELAASGPTERLRLQLPH
jgi:hypothetical protein